MPEHHGPTTGGQATARLLDQVVSRLATTRRTFTEDEAFAALWQQGYELVPQMDARFVLARDADGTHPPHWRLDTQMLANNRLLDLLHDGEWDGRGLDTLLERLDVQDGIHYVFCAVDPRFVLELDGRVAPAEREHEVALDPEARRDLDALGPSVLERWHAEGNAPWTVRRVTETLGTVGWTGAGERGAWLRVRTWLRAWPAVMRVGADYWVPIGVVPAVTRPMRLAVLPIASKQGGVVLDAETRQTQAQVDEEVHTAGGRDDTLPSEDPRTVGASARWTAILRTANLLGGYLPVPARCRGAYPPQPLGAGTWEVLRGKWFATGDDLWLWLDRAHDQLCGSDLARQLEWCEAGERVQVEWMADVVLLRVDGVDLEVQREETRLVDLQELAALRGGRGESYRQSLLAILRDTPQGLTFPEVVTALRERQGHETHRGTIRSVLSAGGFLCREGRWYAPTDVEESPRRLRAALARTLVSTNGGDGSMPPDAGAALQVTAQAIQARLHQLVARMRGE